MLVLIDPTNIILSFTALLLLYRINATISSLSYRIYIGS